MSKEQLRRYKADVRRIHRKLSADALADMARAEDYDGMVEALLPFAMSLVTNYSSNCGFEVEDDVRQDLIQAANLSLLTAVRSWNPDAENASALSTWVAQAINRDVHREFTKQRQVVKNTYEESVLAFTPNFEQAHTLEGVEITDAAVLDSLPTTGVSAEDEAMELEERALALSLLDVLTDRHRQVLTLTELQGLSYSEASEILGVPRSTVARLRNDALEVIRNETKVKTDGRNKLES